MLSEKLKELVELTREYESFDHNNSDYSEKEQELLDKFIPIEYEIEDYLDSLSQENLYKLTGEIYPTEKIVIDEIQINPDEPDEDGNINKDLDSIDIDFIVYENENDEDGGWDSVNMSIKEFNEFLENIEKEK